MMGREKPETPCSQILSEDEWHVLSALAIGKVADTAPSARQAMHWIGKLGGWMSRGKQDNPGTTCMWRGLGRLPNIVQGYRLALKIHGVRAGPDLFDVLRRRVEGPLVGHVGLLPVRVAEDRELLLRHRMPEVRDGMS